MFSGRLLTQWQRRREHAHYDRVDVELPTMKSSRENRRHPSLFGVKIEPRPEAVCTLQKHGSKGLVRLVMNRDNGFASESVLQHMGRHVRMTCTFMFIELTAGC